MSRFDKNIIELLRVDHPDLSAWTIICANERAVDPLQYLIHSGLGGILPRVESLDSYLTGKNTERLNLQPVPADEQLLYFIQFIAERFPDDSYAARRAAHLLPLMTKLAQYNISRETIFGSERFTEDEWNKLEEYLETAQAFRVWLSKLNFFMPELETAALEAISPGEKDVFIGLPEITPVTGRFYHKIRKDRLFIDQPLFGADLSGPEELPFDSAKNLVLAYGGTVFSSDGAGIGLVSLQGLHSLVDLVTLEVSNFLKERSGDEQLMIFLLDESLTPMLWNRSLRFYGNAVNLAVWLPFSTTAAGKRLLAAIEKAEISGVMPDFKKFATECAVELSRNRDYYVREECEALEVAISFSTLLDAWKERLGSHMAGAAKMLIETKKFRVTGSRSAPVQAVGFGHVSGEPFSRGLILSLDSGIMPSQPFEGPFINPVHVPQLRKSVFEYEDLIFRQILAQGERIKIVGVEDAIRERTPGYYMSLLAQEFGKTVTAMPFQEVRPSGTSEETAVITMDENLRNKLKDFHYSFSSLTKILACPFLFYHQYILRIKPPAFMDDDEKINMRMGDFVHQFLQKLSDGAKDGFDDWETLFDDLWLSDENAELRDMEGINIYMLNAKIFLREIYDDEKTSGERLIFADNALACEKIFTGMIAGTYKITGRSDRLADIDGKTEVIDFKYSKKQDKYKLSDKTSVLGRFNEKGVLHPAAQLIIYQHFNKGVQGARFYFLKEPARDRQIKLAAEESAQAEALMLAIKERLDAIIGGSELAPSHDCDECECCQFQALCGREDFYKARRND